MIKKLLGYIWGALRPFLLSKVMAFVNDPRVRTLALKAIERASRLDIDKDGKYDHATAELKAEAIAIGIKHYNSWVNTAIQIWYEWWKQNLPPVR